MEMRQQEQMNQGGKADPETEWFVGIPKHPDSEGTTTQQ
jgi:hypothetical protein